MIFNKEFSENFQNQLEKNKYFFQNDLIQEAKESIRNHRKIAFIDNSAEYIPFKINFEVVEKVIKKSIEASQPIFQITQGLEDGFPSLIFFKVMRNEQPYFNSEQYSDFFLQYKLLHIECINQFFINENHYKIHYDNHFSNLKIFNEPKIDDLENFGVLKNRNDKYNKSIWIEYIKSLCELTFNKFRFSKEHSTKNVYRFIKQVNEDLFIGFEFYVDITKKELNYNLTEVEPYFNIIVFNNQFNPDEPIINYTFRKNKNIISLGNLSNPLFTPMCLTMEAFKLLTNKTNPMDFDSPMKFHKKLYEVSQNNYLIKYPDEFGEDLKKYAFFKIYLLEYFSRSYLGYIEKSILGSLSPGSIS